MTSCIPLRSIEQWAALATEAIDVAERPACTIDNAECSGDVWARLAAEAADSALSPWAQLVEEDAVGVCDGDDLDCVGGEAQIPRPPMTRKGGSTDSFGGMAEAFSILGFSQRCKRGRRLSDDGCLTYALLRAASKMERIPSAIVMEVRSCLLVIPDLLLRVSTIAAYPRALLIAN